MSAAGRLSPPLRAATLRAVIGLLAVTGMRIGEYSHSTTASSTSTPA